MTWMRRDVLKMMGLAAGAAALAACGVRGSGESSGRAASPTATTVTAPASGATALPDDAPVCVLTPESTEGPFYVDTGLLRRNIAEDRVGAPLRMAVRVVAVDAGCAPVKDAVVDLWHADAAGVYSGFPGQLGGLDTSGQTFLRGTQVTDADGVAVFDTIYPGWYPGRTVHIHFKAHHRNTTYVTSQFYFPDAVTDGVFTRAPYSDRPNRDTRNDNDSVLRGDPAERNMLASVMEDGDGYLGAITVGVVA